ncbi:MAG TPA: anthranilate synthase component I, partial [Rhodobacter sp.]|nr:anthranilate synthase component I [Rhodobacter sp.]
MALTSDFETFERGWAKGENQVVYTRLAADLDTPVSLMLKLAAVDTNSFMLESVTGGELRGRYSVVGLKPDLIWQCHGAQSRINRLVQRDATAFEALAGHPLQSLRDLIAESKITLPDDLPPVAAGLFGYLGYDMIRLVEHLPNVNPDPLGLPDAILLRPSVVAVLDGVKGEVTIVAPAWVQAGQTAAMAYAGAKAAVQSALFDLEAAPNAPSRDFGTAAPVGLMRSNFTHQAYLAAVEKAKDYIRAGDIFQVV